MKASLLIFASALLAISSFAQVNSTWKEHKAEDIGFTIKYPPTWTLAADAPDAKFFIRSPKENESDAFGENFNLQFRELAGQVTDLRHYVKLNTEELETFDNYKKLSDRYFYSFGKEVYEIVFSANVSAIPFRLKWKQWYVFYKNKGYVITYCTEEDKKDSWAAIEAAIFRSIRIR